jgi:hypothetical protein
MSLTLGFSTKRCTWPYSSMTTTPYLEGSSTLVTRMVASELRALWKSSMSFRGKSQMTSLWEGERSVRQEEGTGAVCASGGLGASGGQVAAVQVGKCTAAAGRRMLLRCTTTVVALLVVRLICYLVQLSVRMQEDWASNKVRVVG